MSLKTKTLPEEESWFRPAGLSAFKKGLLLSSKSYLSSWCTLNLRTRVQIVHQSPSFIVTFDERRKQY
jgi:hypothetical protein